MNIASSIDGSKHTLQVEGMLTVQTSPELTAAVEQVPASVCDVDIDLAGVTYVSSAGLRVFASIHQRATACGGAFRLLRPTDNVYEMLEMTGLTDVLAVER